MVTHVFYNCVRNDLFDFKCYLNKTNKTFCFFFTNSALFEINWFDITVCDFRYYQRQAATSNALHPMYLQLSCSATPYICAYVHTFILYTIHYLQNGSLLQNSFVGKVCASYFMLNSATNRYNIYDTFLHGI